MKRKGSEIDQEPLLTVYITTSDQSPNTCVQGQWCDMWRTSSELSTMYRMLKTPWYHGDMPLEVVRGSVLQRYNTIESPCIRQDILDMIQEQCHAYQEHMPTRQDMLQQLRQRTRYCSVPFFTHTSTTHATTHVTMYDTTSVQGMSVLECAANVLVDYWTWRRGHSVACLPGTYAVAAIQASSKSGIWIR